LEILINLHENEKDSPLLIEGERLALGHTIEQCFKGQTTSTRVLYQIYKKFCQQPCWMLLLEPKELESRATEFNTAVKVDFEEIIFRVKAIENLIQGIIFQHIDTFYSTVRVLFRNNPALLRL